MKCKGLFIAAWVLVTLGAGRVWGGPPDTASPIERHGRLNWARDLKPYAQKIVNKNETSAAFNSRSIRCVSGKGNTLVQQETPLVPTDIREDGTPFWPVEQLSESGAWVRARIKGIDTPMNSDRSETSATATAEKGDDGGPIPTGAFTGLPWDFESGSGHTATTLGGWRVAEDSPVTVDFTIENVRSSALAFAYSWESVGSGWNGAPQITSSFVNLPAARYRTLMFDFYYQVAALTTGSLELQPVIQSPQHGYWLQLEASRVSAGRGTDAGNGWHRIGVRVPLTSSETPLNAGAVIRNLIFIVIRTDYEGMVAFDNITLE